MKSIQVFTHRRTRRAGSTLPIALIFLAGFSVVGLTMLNLSSSTDRNTDRAQSKTQATLLAESGMYALYDAIREQMWDSGSYPLRLNSRDLNANSRRGSVSVGSFSARVINATSSMEDINVSGRNVRRTNWVFDIEATGVGEGGVQSVIRGRFTAAIDTGLRSITTVTSGQSQAGKIYYPAAALSANGQVRFQTNPGFRVYSPDGRSGHVIGNQGITWNPRSGNKSSLVNPNILDIQGLFLVPNPALAMTLGNNGLGNSNGRKNYLSPAINDVPGLPNNPANTVVGMPNAVQFADQTETERWRTTWLQTTSRSNATRFNRNISATDVPQRPGDQWRVIETPAYIDGHLDIPAGQQLRLMPSSSNPTENVVYVRGNVRNLGHLINLGVTIVVEGKYSDGPSAQYRLDTQGSPYSSRSTLLQNSAMISLHPGQPAMEFETNDSVTTGTLYAARGGIEVRGNAEFRGLLSAFKDIDIRPDRGDSFVVHYEPDAAGSGDFDPESLSRIDVTMVPDGITQPFNPSPITNWVQSK